MFRFNARRRLLAPAVLIVAALAAPVPAAAITVYGATIVSNTCPTATYSWKGDVWYADVRWVPEADQSRGTVRYCADWYRINDADSAADYYMMTVRVWWTTSHEAPSPASPIDNYASVKITSTVSAIGASYEASPEGLTTTAAACGPNVSVGVSAFFISASVNLNEFLCEGGKIKLDSATGLNATWSSPNVVKTQKWELAYFTKVGQGARPTLAMTLKYPCYVPQLTNGFWLYGKVMCGVGASYKV